WEREAKDEYNDFVSRAGWVRLLPDPAALGDMDWILLDYHPLSQWVRGLPFVHYRIAFHERLKLIAESGVLDDKPGEFIAPHRNLEEERNELKEGLKNPDPFVRAAAQRALEHEIEKSDNTRSSIIGGLRVIPLLIASQLTWSGIAGWLVGHGTGAQTVFSALT